MQSSDRKRVGIDVGGVIIRKDYSSVEEDSSFDPEKTRFVEKSLETIAKLSQKYDLYIVSYCGKKREEQTRNALRAVNISIPEEKWYFTRSRQEKGPVCSKLELDYFIDDTEQVVRIVSKACPQCKILWFASNKKLPGNVFNVSPVLSWVDVENKLL